MNLQTPPGQGMPRASDVISSMQEAQMASMLSNWKLTPATMMSHLDPTWIPARWLQFLSLKIAQCIAKGNCGLLISAPPRHGKSLLSTIATPLWVLENFPEKNVVVATYGEELSTDFSRQIRDHIYNHEAELNVRLRSDTQRVTNFLTTQGGGLKAVGLGGAITGRGAHVLVIDDYIKNDKEAMSPAYLEGLFNWYLTVARTRLEPGAVIIILATRWASNDLHGRIMKMQAQTGRRFFEYVTLPAIAVEGDPIGRAPGEVLFPERYDHDAIYGIRTELGSRWFGAMFQQNPQEEENSACDPAWFQRIEREEFWKRIEAARAAGYTIKWVRDWDMASTKNAGDFTSGALCAYIKELDQFYVYNINRGQYSAARAELEFQMSLREDLTMIEGPLVNQDSSSYILGMEQEPGSSGAYSIRHFQGIAREVRRGIRVNEHRATTSKLLNAQPVLAAAEAGKVWIVGPPVIEDALFPTLSASDAVGDWTKPFYDEVELFPEAPNDDQMDSVSGAYKLATGKKSLGASIGRSQAAKEASTQLGVTTPENVQKRRSGVTFGRNGQ